MLDDTYAAVCVALLPVVRSVSLLLSCHSLANKRHVSYRLFPRSFPICLSFSLHLSISLAVLIIIPAVFTFFVLTSSVVLACCLCSCWPPRRVLSLFVKTARCPAHVHHSRFWSLAYAVRFI